MRGRASALAAALALGVVACGGSDSQTPQVTTTATTTATAAAAAAPALCGPLRRRVTGRITTASASELSGLVRSRSQPGVLWTHNDSGDRARLLAVGDDGRLRGEFTVPGAVNVDWEDIAIRGRTLYIADIGDNVAARTSVTVYRVAEPRVADGARSTAPATPIELRYPRGPRDAEALLVDPVSGSLVIVEKRFDGRSGVYVADRPTGGAVSTLRMSGRLSLGLAELVTAADVSADGRTLALRTYTTLLVWSRRRGESVAAALRRRPCASDVDFEGEGQGEALALSGSGRSAYTVPEGTRPAIRAYMPR